MGNICVLYVIVYILHFYCDIGDFAMSPVILQINQNHGIFAKSPQLSGYVAKKHAKRIFCKKMSGYFAKQTKSFIYLQNDIILSIKVHY